MFCGQHKWLTIIFPVQCAVSVIVTYKLAVLHEHVEAFLPYVSETGNYFPEKSVFTICLNISAVLAGYIIYIRHKHVDFFLEYKVETVWIYFNVATTFVGALMCCGFSLVGTVSYLDHDVTHLVGAGISFLSGYIYMILQTILSGKTVDKMAGTNLCILVFRIVLCVCGVISVTIHIYYGVEVIWGSITEDNMWKRTVSALTEWSLGASILTFFGTFFSEFSHFTISSPAVTPNDKLELGENQPLPKQQDYSTMR